MSEFKWAGRRMKHGDKAVTVVGAPGWQPAVVDGDVAYFIVPCLDEKGSGYEAMLHELSACDDEPPSNLPDADYVRKLEAFVLYACNDIDAQEASNIIGVPPAESFLYAVRHLIQQRREQEGS